MKQNKQHPAANPFRRTPLSRALGLALTAMLLLCGCTSGKDPSANGGGTTTTAVSTAASVTECTAAQTTTVTTTVATTAVTTRRTLPAPTTTRKPTAAVTTAPMKKSGLLFWEARPKQGKGVLYLLGSIHIGEESMYPMPQAVEAAYKASSCIAVESDVIALESDLQTQLQCLRPMMYNGAKARQALGDIAYNKAKQLLTDAGLYSSALDYYKPFMWSSFLDALVEEASPYKSEFGVDRHYLERAHRDGKQVLEIEDPVETYRMLATIPDSVFRVQIEEFDLAQNLEMTDWMLSVWKQGNAQAIASTNDTSDVPAELKADFDAYIKVMITDRNKQMVAKAKQYLAEGKTCLYIVGAAHMVGSDGIVNALKQAGYQVTAR